MRQEKNPAGFFDMPTSKTVISASGRPLFLNLLEYV
jgi:hypothetical protein